ncbi:MAG: hypothetical protein DRI97_09285 [Bacteroidetes bacterium]|nr:MAG: hypothetical protein DRI97_09285 [Bacteroidota bacterium]
MRKFLYTIFFLCLISESLQAQIETHWIDTTTHKERMLGFFFTNRPIKETNDGTVTFRNRWTRQTGNLYFSLYNFESDSILLKYRAFKTCDKKVYPTEPVDNNIFYKIYDNLRIGKGIKKFVFVIPGYGKTFEKQLTDFMFRLQKVYGDTLSEKTAIITFAWGDQSVAPFYYKGKRAANRAANDFSIFQHMLEDFVTDSVFFANNPNDLSLNLMCTSMGNQLLKRYLIKREKQGIDLVPVYKKIAFIGSDVPLYISQYMNMKLRMGRAGVINPGELPSSVLFLDLTKLISWEDLPAMGYDYLLRNKEITKTSVESSLKEEL